MLKDKKTARGSERVGPRASERAGTRARRRGAAMVESIVVIPIFILFFVGMMYFRKMYQNQLAVMRLARIAAVSYGMNGCNGSPTAAIDEDIAAGGISVGSVDTLLGSTHIGSTSGSDPKTGQKSGNPVGAALGAKGMDGDKIATASLSSSASAGSPLYAMIFRSTVTSTSYLSCGEPHKAGDVTDVLVYVKDLFSLKP